jgi:hypothetical protein
MVGYGATRLPPYGATALREMSAPRASAYSQNRFSMFPVIPLHWA